jgi:hypothetical protein
MFNGKCINSIFLPSVVGTGERELLYWGLKKGFRINLYDEGIPKNFASLTVLRKKRLCLRIKLNISKVLVRLFSYGELNSALGSFEGIIKLGFITEYYSFFPNLFHYDKINKHKLSFENVLNELPTVTTFKSIFLSRPMSEDKIISFENEMSILKVVSKNITMPWYIKFHPRESQHKKKYILKRFHFRMLPEYIMNLPAENLLKLQNLEYIYG